MIHRAMDRPIEPLGNALATLQARWGSAVVRLGDGRPAVAPRAVAGSLAVPASPAGVGEAGMVVHGALALAPHPEARPTPRDVGLAHGVISTGFPELDAILGPAGLPREASVVLRGGPSSGKTTLALRCLAEAQASGDIVAWLDLARAFDPVEALGRGVDLRWLLVIRPADTPEGLALAGSLLGGRCVGLLVVDLPARPGPRLEEPLRRLAAHARRTGARLLLLEPETATSALQATLAQSSGLRLELARRAWLRLGRDVVGQRTAVSVVKNRYGPPGRSVEVDIHYLAEGQRGGLSHRLAGTDVESWPGSSVPGPRLSVPAPGLTLVSGPASTRAPVARPRLVAV
jgi:RecA/RadA recombinase